MCSSDLRIPIAIGILVGSEQLRARPGSALVGELGLGGEVLRPSGLLPMVAALIPLFKAPGVRQRDLLLPMHFTAISVWVEGMRLLPGKPANERVAFYNGLGAGLIAAACLASIVGYALAARLPTVLAATLLFLTPMALLMSVSRNSKTLIDRLAFAFGLVVGPVLAAQKIGLDLMWTGLIAGSAAYVIHRVREAAR
mgnify:CR=1 FL=1